MRSGPDTDDGEGGDVCTPLRHTPLWGTGSAAGAGSAAGSAAGGVPSAGSSAEPPPHVDVTAWTAAEVGTSPNPNPYPNPNPDPNPNPNPNQVTAKTAMGFGKKSTVGAAEKSAVQAKVIIV